MKIGIIVFSETGNTISVAQKIKEKLSKNKHNVKLERVEINGDFKSGNNFSLKTIPKIDNYDRIIFGSPVIAFSLSPPMKQYLKQISSLKDKNVALFTTQYFPFEWMGGKNVISQMKKLLEKKDAKVITSGIINWSNKNRDKKIIDVVDKISKMIIL